MKRVYIATKLENREQAQKLAAMLSDEGHWIASRWHTPESIATQRDAHQVADFCFGDLDACSCVVVILYPGIKGTLVEAGFAIGAGLPLYVVGDPGDAPTEMLLATRKMISFHQSIRAVTEALR